MTNAVSDEIKTIQYAIDELGQYLSRITSRQPDIRIGLMSSFPEIDSPSVDDPALDDAIYIDTHGNVGTIAGINARSVLLAVYRYLTEIGCRWVRPGYSGEYIPKLDRLPDVKLEETPSYRHRGICIEGAVSFEHVRDMIDFIPKLGFNGYFIQFREAHIFFNRWYSHRGNPLIKGTEVSIEQAQQNTAILQDEIYKRGLIYHAVGHGWTCEPLGIRGLGWDPYKGDILQDISQYFAQVDGERKLFGKIALNTNLCYSNPNVQKMVVDEVVSYIESHPKIDILHFWLADGSNNTCECENCRKMRPSDFYVEMLNAIDAQMAEKKLNAKIVFLIYTDLLWPPIKERISNPDRFVLMFAPIERTYSRAFSIDKSLPELPSYERNKLVTTKGVEENVAFLRAWQEQFNGDSFDFDYHLMWDHFNDPGYMHISKTLSQDIKGLERIGLHGFVSCQTQRAFLPTGLPMAVMGRTLWDNSTNFDVISDDYSKSAFGTDGELCRHYLDTLSELFDPVYLRGEKPIIDPEAAARFGRIAKIIDEFVPVIERNIQSENLCWSESWRLLSHHAQICISLAGVLQARASANKDVAIEHWNQLKQMVREKEMSIHQVMDVRLFLLVFGEYKFEYDPVNENY